MVSIPNEHVVDSLKLSADAEIDLFELTPLVGGTLYFTTDTPVTWQGNTYEALPCSITGEEWTTDKTPMPTFQAGQEDLDLLPFKGLINSGYLDGATLIRKRVLYDNLINNRNIKEVTYFRVRRVAGYSRSQVSLQLATFSNATSQTLPFRQYLPPEFPWVDL